MLLRKSVSGNYGNISFLTMAITVFFSILFVVIFDICQIFIAREETKNASDAASLAAAQNLLFFDSNRCCEIADEVAELNGCDMTGCSSGYDEAVVEAEKSVSFIMLDKLFKVSGKVTSISRARVLYPWDEHFNFCDSYEFSY